LCVRWFATTHSARRMLACEKSVVPRLTRRVCRVRLSYQVRHQVSSSRSCRGFLLSQYSPICPRRSSRCLRMLGMTAARDNPQFADGCKRFSHRLVYSQVYRESVPREQSFSLPAEVRPLRLRSTAWESNWTVHLCPSVSSFTRRARSHAFSRKLSRNQRERVNGSFLFPIA
jgi:hypothetical protein